MAFLSSLYGIVFFALFGFPFWALCLYGPFHLTLYRVLKRHRWLYALVIALGLLVGSIAMLLAIAAALSAMFIGGRLASQLGIAVIATVIGLLLLSSTLARRRLQRELEANQYAVEDSRLLRRTRIAGIALSWVGGLLVLATLAFLAYMMFGNPAETSGAGIGIVLALSVALPIWGVGGILTSSADPALGT